jgi:hypothetical protein
VSAGWREAQASALDAQASAIADALDDLEDVEAALEHRRRDALLAELRGLASALRSEQGAIRSEASALRSPPPAPAMPIALTTRFPRRRPAAVADTEEPA